MYPISLNNKFDFFVGIGFRYYEQTQFFFIFNEAKYLIGASVVSLAV